MNQHPATALLLWQLRRAEEERRRRHPNRPRPRGAISKPQPSGLVPLAARSRRLPSEGGSYPGPARS
jgi:hypothetical protein